MRGFHSAIPSRAKRRRSAFTLIELLLVAAILSILALIAVPHLLESQTRAKHARARADLRQIATAIETYAVDWGDYPRNWFYGYGTIPPDLTTPVAYLSTLYMHDPFAHGLADPRARVAVWKEFTEFYTYNRILSYADAKEFAPTSPWRPGAESVDGPAPYYNKGALRKYGHWRLFSIGPDRQWMDGWDVRTSDTPYDPTNGTVSFGNVLRTQVSIDGLVTTALP